MEAVGLCWSHPGANLPAAQRRLWQSGGHGSRAKQSLHRPSLLEPGEGFRAVRNPDPCLSHWRSKVWHGKAPPAST